MRYRMHMRNSGQLIAAVVSVPRDIQCLHKMARKPKVAVIFLRLRITAQDIKRMFKIQVLK